MRLTLRTLLAYLDDRLPPANARELGQKIAKSPFAMELAERIRDVVRRRRLAAPEKPGPMLDANLVAEYLDDQLTPELVARIEREILQSDAALAEVAATHEILGLLRDPVALETRLRDRLYALDPSGKLEVVRLLAGGTSAEGPAPAGSGSRQEWKPLTAGTTTPRRYGLLIAGVLAVVWVGVLLTDSHLFSSAGPRPDGQPADLVAAEGGGAAQPADQAVGQPGAVQAAAQPAGAAVPPTVAGGAAAVAAAEPAAAAAAPAAEAGQAAGKPAAPATVAAPPADSPVATPATVAAAAAAPAAVPARPEVAMAEPPQQPQVSAAPGAPGSDTAAVPAAAAEPPVEAAEKDMVYPVYVTDEYQMALLLQEATGEWRRLAVSGGANLPADQLRLRDWRDVLQSRWLGIPAPFRVQLAVNGGGWRSILAGSSVAQVINTDVSGLWLAEGRTLVMRDAAATIPDDAAAVFTLRVGRATMPLSLMTPDTTVGIEVRPVPLPPAAPRPLDDQDAEGPAAARGWLFPGDFQAQLYVLQGSLRLPGQGTDPPTELLKSQAITWRVLNSGEVTDVALVAATPQQAIPDWVFTADAEVVPERRAVMQQVAAAYAAGESLARTATTLSADRNPLAGTLAVSVPALTQDVETLMTILLQSGEETVRRAVIDALSRIATLTPAGRDQVRQALETRLSMPDVPVMLNLIVGLSDQDVRNPAVTTELLALLSHDRPAMRELAFYRMEQVTRDRFGYHADSDPGRRKEAVRRWQRHIERQDGRLVP